jgi:hypothetical protein
MSFVDKSPCRRLVAGENLSSSVAIEAYSLIITVTFGFDMNVRTRAATKKEARRFFLNPIICVKCECSCREKLEINRPS